MNRPRHTKIVATLGPASSSPEAIQALYEAGVRGFRLNFSHGTHEDHRASAAAIRAIEERYDDPVSILVDLQGPKLRFGRFEDGGVALEAGDGFRIDHSDRPGDRSRGPLPHRGIFEALSEETEIPIDDGKVRLGVESLGKDSAMTRVLAGGRVSDHKGVNLPNPILPIPILTEKDREDLDAGPALGADRIALSFVRQPEDVVEAKHPIAGRAAIVVKVEKPTAVDRFDEIVDVFDGNMVARGDLGVVPIHTEDVSSVDEMVDKACAITSDKALASVGEEIVITAGMPFGTPGATNLLRLARALEPLST